MAYLGRQPLVGNYQVLDAITATTTDTYALTKASVAVFPQTPANCIVSLNGVIQAPFDSYTISGSNIVFASALTGTDSIDFITVLGDVLNVGTVSDGTIGLAKLSATGTKDATTFLRGDNSFAEAGATAGQVIQVVQTVKTDTFSATLASGTFTGEVTGLTASITPSSASNKVLVHCVIDMGCSAGTRLSTALYKGGSVITSATGDSAGSRSRVTSSSNIGATTSFYMHGMISFMYLDSPSTTSSTTYSVRMMQGSGGSATIYVNRASEDDDASYQVRSISTITVMEVKG